MQSLLFVVLASIALSCDGQRYVQSSEGTDNLATLLLALNTPAAKRYGHRLPQTRMAYEDLADPRGDRGAPPGGRPPRDEPPGRTTGRVVPLDRDVRAHSAEESAVRQAAARSAIEEAARVTEATAARAIEIAERMEKAAMDAAAKETALLEAQAAAAKEDEGFVFPNPFSKAFKEDRQMEIEAEGVVPEVGKDLPQILSESMPFPSLDARAARIFLPLLGISGLAAGSAIYSGTPEEAAAPAAAPKPAVKAVEVAPPVVPAPKPPVAVAPPVVPPPAAKPVAAPAVTEAVASTVAMDAAMKKFFPNALESSTMDSKIATVLDKRGYTKANTLFASSLCPDEVNAEEGDLVELMKSRWGEHFGLGGLAGLPFVGKAGFGAYAHHVPDNGKLLILFAPHVGVDYDGKVGKIKRLNQKGLSTACGAAIGAYNAIMKDALTKGASPPAPKKLAKSRNDFDGQIEYIVAKLQPRLAGIEDAPDEMAYIAYQMYSIVREFMIDQVLTAGGYWNDVSEMSVVGGIMVNRGDSDRFVPLFFQSKSSEKGEAVDLYEEAFGAKPDLSYVLGDKAKAAGFLKYDLNTLSMTSEAKLFKLFPGALDSHSMDSKVANTLGKYGFTSANTLFATSTCPDEVNSKQGEMVELMKSRWGENFALGGLAGLPFVGKSGFGAYAHHVPDGGKLFILFAPHVGIDFEGKIGALKRVNQKGVSTACGATIGAYNGIIKEALDDKLSGKGATGSKTGDAFDAQIEYIKNKLRSRLKGIDSAPDPIAFITYQMYAVTREFVDEVLTNSNLFDGPSEVCLLGGIMVNGDTSDHFMPLLFESKKGKDGDINDLYGETFGYRPDLSYVLGDGATASNFYKTDLRALQ